MSLVSESSDGGMVSFTKDLVRFFQDRDIPLLAGSVAYSAFLSLVPLVLLLVILATVIGGPAFRQTVLSMASQYLTPDALGFVEDAIMQASNTTSFSIFGGVVLLWAVLKVFRTLDKAFSELYQVNSDPGLLEQFVDGLTVLGVMAAATLAMVAVGTALSLAGAIPLASNLPAPAFRALGLLALVVGLSVVFLAMYYVFPDPDMTVRGALPGAVFAAVGWTLLQGLFQIYVSMANPSRLYGVLGGIILFITWLYFSAVIILTGAGVNIVLSGQRWSTG